MTTTVWILSALCVLLFAFAVMGVRSGTRGTPVRLVRHLGESDGPPPVSDGVRLLRHVELHTRVRFEPGHRIEVGTRGDEIFPRLWADLRGARRSITFQMYYAKPGRVADEFTEIAIERARAGVQVFVLYDAFGAMPLKKRYYRALEAGGVRVAKFRPVEFLNLDRAYNRSHMRVVVVDGRIGHTGGWGIDDKWLGDGLHHDQWRDTDLRFTGPAVLQHQATFAASWAEATGELLTGDLLFPDASADAATGADGAGDMPGGGAVAALLHHEPAVGSTTGERVVTLSIAAARERLYIANAYFVPDDARMAMLVDAARRGVDVRVLTTSAETDTKTTRYAARARYERLLAGGVRIFEYLPAMMHSKTMVADGRWCVAGSMNFDNRSLAFNDESNLLALDAPLGAALERHFLDDLRHSEEITLDAFRRRPLREKALERVANVFSRVL